MRSHSCSPPSSLRLCFVNEALGGFSKAALLQHRHPDDRSLRNYRVHRQFWLLFLSSYLSAHTLPLVACEVSEKLISWSNSVLRHLDVLSELLTPLLMLTPLPLVKHRLPWWHVNNFQSRSYVCVGGEWDWSAADQLNALSVRESSLCCRPWLHAWVVFDNPQSRNMYA